jgi:hypothetical protein
MRRVSAEKNVSTLWFSRDGTCLLFASPRVVTMLGPGAPRNFEAQNNLRGFESARFINGGPDVVVAATHAVLRWDFRDAKPTTVLHVHDGEMILAADVLGREVIVWTQQPKD